MSQVTIRAKLGTVTAIQLGLAHAILVAAEEVFAAKPELKATQVITDENEVVVVSKVKAGHTVEFTGREFKQANIARVSAPREYCQSATVSAPRENALVEKSVGPEAPVADEQYED